MKREPCPNVSEWQLGRAGNRQQLEETLTWSSFLWVTQTCFAWQGYMIYVSQFGTPKTSGFLLVFFLTNPQLATPPKTHPHLGLSFPRLTPKLVGFRLVHHENQRFPNKHHPILFLRHWDLARSPKNRGSEASAFGV